ncbi:MAG: STAS domain-containing protein [Melioribacter sp.]|nr:STAS domain-containing protein [Melioribacter sp.]
MIVEEFFDDIVVEIINADRATIKQADELKKTIYDKIEKGYNKIVVDLSKVDFIDSTFLGVIVNALKKVAAHEGDLKLVGFKPAVRAMFELTRLFRVFESYSDLKEAIKSFQKN